MMLINPSLWKMLGETNVLMLIIDTTNEMCLDNVGVLWQLRKLRSSRLGNSDNFRYG